MQTLRRRIAKARALQAARQGERRNCELDADELDKLVPIAGELRPLLSRATKTRNLSARAVQSIRRVARTLADLDGAAEVAAGHVARAVALGSPFV